MSTTIVLMLLAVCWSAVSAQESFKQGDYALTWQIKDEQVVFELQHQLADDHWTGVAFGSGMASLDFIEVAVRGGQVTVTDRAGRGYAYPQEDGENNVQMVSSSYENGIVSAKFTRPIVSTDTAHDKSLSGCIDWWFPVSGGKLNSVHGQRPTSKKFCDAKASVPAVQPQAPGRRGGLPKLNGR